MVTLADSAKVYGNAKVTDSYVSGFATICDDSIVSNSWVTDQTIIKRNAVVDKCKILNACMIFDNAKVTSSLVKDGCYIMKNAIVNKCILKDTAMVGGTTQVTNCSMSNQANFVDGVHESKNIDEIRKRLYSPPSDGQPWFKKAHAIAYALTIVLQLHIIEIPSHK